MDKINQDYLQEESILVGERFKREIDPIKLAIARECSLGLHRKHSYEKYLEYNRLRSIRGEPLIWPQPEQGITVGYGQTRMPEKPVGTL